MKQKETHFVRTHGKLLFPSSFFINSAFLYQFPCADTHMFVVTLHPTRQINFDHSTLNFGNVNKNIKIWKVWISPKTWMFYHAALMHFCTNFIKSVNTLYENSLVYQKAFDNFLPECYKDS